MKWINEFNKAITLPIEIIDEPGRVCMFRFVQLPSVFGNRRWTAEESRHWCAYSANKSEIQVNRTKSAASRKMLACQTNTQAGQEWSCRFNKATQFDRPDGSIWRSTHAWHHVDRVQKVLKCVPMQTTTLKQRKKQAGICVRILFKKKKKKYKEGMALQEGCLVGRRLEGPPGRWPGSWKGGGRKGLGEGRGEKEKGGEKRKWRSNSESKQTKIFGNVKQ